MTRMTTAAAGISRAAGHMSGGTNQRELLRNAKASADAARLETQVRELAALITADCVATADAAALTMEWTGFGSWIIPVCVVTGQRAGGDFRLTAATGPGREELPAVWLLAFEMATRARLEANAAARLAAEGGR